MHSIFLVLVSWGLCYRTFQYCNFLISKLKGGTLEFVFDVKIVPMNFPYFKNCTSKFMQANWWHHKLFHFHLSFWIWEVFFSIWVFFHEHSRITGLQREGEGISLPLPLVHRHLNISRAITAESSPLHIASSRTRTGNLCFPSASR